MIFKIKERIVMYKYFFSVLSIIPNLSTLCNTRLYNENLIDRWIRQLLTGQKCSPLKQMQLKKTHDSFNLVTYRTYHFE